MNLSFLDKIDAYYEKKDKKEFYYTLLAMILAIGFIIFYFIVPVFSEPLVKNEKQVQNYENKIMPLNNQINIFNITNIKLKRELEDMKKELISLKKDKDIYQEIIKTLNFINFNKYDWAQFVKLSIIDAKSQGLEVMLVKNIYNEDKIKQINKKKKNIKDKKINKKNIKNNFIVKKVDFGLNLKGNYKNFIYYIYKYEDKKILIRVNNIKITAPNKYYIEFSLYGYKL